jgi:high-affinity Fe2+/Pb2+ permease
MHTHHFHRLAFALLTFLTVAGTAVAAAAAWVFGLTAWIACVALLLSAVLVAGVLKLHEAWREARWDAGQRLR